VNSLIVGVDLSPIKPIPRVTTFQSDITTDKCRVAIRQQFKSWKADTVLHDGAPNVGTAWVQDSFNQAELSLQAMKLATEFLVEGGTFVTKVFRSKDYNSLLWVFNQLFTKVEATKPPSSRNVSAEIFVVCRGFKAPKRIDPKFLDPRSVFAELPEAAPNNEAKIFNPEIKKRKRDGYEEGNYTQFKEASASDFVQTADPIAMLGSLNRFYFTQPPGGDVILAALDKLLETTNEIRDCCMDLRVLGRKEFKNLLRWRLKVREKLGFALKNTVPDVGDSEVAEVEQMDEELEIQEELQALNEKEAFRRKRERRRKNEKKQKEIVRMQLHMTAPSEIGLEQAGPDRVDSMFTLKTLHNPGALNKISRGNMVLVEGTDARFDHHGSSLSSAEATDESDVEEDRLDCYLDLMYKQYQERRSDADTKFRASKAKAEYEDGDWEGFPADEHRCDERDRLEDDDSDQPSDYETQEHRSLLSVLDHREKGPNGLSKRAAQFFKRDIFQTVGDIKPDMVTKAPEITLCELDSSASPHHSGNVSEDNSTPLVRKLNDIAGSYASDNSFEVVKHNRPDAQWESHSEPGDVRRLGMGNLLW
jgi:AdoMet-dependent rRNA methyltransferase SPB1